MFCTKYKILTVLFISFFVVGFAQAQDQEIEQLSSELETIFGTLNNELMQAKELAEQNRPEEKEEVLTSDALAAEMIDRVRLREPEILPSEIESSFFTFNELQLIRQARKGSMFNSMAANKNPNATPEELAAGEMTLDFIEPGVRTLSLGGIVYLSNDDWTIWINGKEVNPTSVPGEVLDINVRKEYVELEWFDSFTNQIFPIRLRPNQTFSLDARLFMPG